MSDPTLKTNRLLLRPMEASDLDALHSIFGDPQVMAAFEEPPYNRQQMRFWLERNLAHQEEYGYGLFSVILKSEDVLIGDCGLEHMAAGGEEFAELGYDFRSDYWNQGYATEAAKVVRNFAFQELNLPRLVSLIRVKNQASKRVAEKVGMHQAAEMKRNGITYWKYVLKQEKRR